MDRTTLLIIIVLAAATLLIPSGAVPFETDAVNEDLVMEPAEGPNGDYAILSRDREIKLVLADPNPSVDGNGLGANAVTPLSRVFTITYTGDETAKIWLTDDSSSIRFYRNDSAEDSLEGSDNSVVLEPGKSLPVGILVDTRGDHDVKSADSFTIHAEEIEADSGINSDTGDAGNDGNINNDNPVEGSDSGVGDGDDTQVEASTPASPAGTGGGPSQPPEQDGTGGGPTPDETVGSGGGLPPNTEDGISQDNSNELIEIDNIGLGSWLIIVTLLGALPSGLAAYRWYN